MAARAPGTQGFKGRRDTAPDAQAPRAASLRVDGGTLLSRQGGQPRGVPEPGGREYEVACRQTLSSGVSAPGPQPAPPAKSLDPTRAARRAAASKARRGQATGRAAPKGAQAKRPKQRTAKGKRGPRKLVRTVLASLAGSARFGWQVAAEAQRRGRDRARRKASVCDGQQHNGTPFAMHCAMLGSRGVRDCIPRLSYLYGAAPARAGQGTPAAWPRYERWRRWAWAGPVSARIGARRAGSARLGLPPAGCAADDPRPVLAAALGSVRNNRGRMDDPRYRRLGLPRSSAPVARTIKQRNARVKGTEEFGRAGGAEARLRLRAAPRSADGTAQRYGDKPRPYPRAVGARRLRPAT